MIRKIVRDLVYREFVLLRICFTLLGASVIGIVLGATLQLLEALIASIVLIGIGFVINILRPSEQALYYYRKGQE